MIKIDKDAFYELPELEEVTGIKIPSLRAAIRSGRLIASKPARNYIVEGKDAISFLKSKSTGGG